MTSSSKKPSIKEIDPDEGGDQDWRTKWQAAKKKLEIYSAELALYIVDPNEDWDQDWRAEWQEARKKLDFYPDGPPRGRGRPRKPPEKKDKLVKFCFSCLKCKEEGQTMWLNLLARGTCMRPVFICKACQKKFTHRY